MSHCILTGGGQGEGEEGEESVEVIFEEGEKEGEEEGGEGEGCQLERVIVPVVIYGAFDLVRYTRTYWL